MTEAYNFLASWQLFPEKGNYELGERPKSGIYKLEAIGGSKQLIVHHNWVTLQGQAFTSSYTVHADGALHPFDNHELADQAQVSFTSSISFEIHFYRSGQVVLHVVH